MENKEARFQQKTRLYRPSGIWWQKLQIQIPKRPLSIPNDTGIFSRKKERKISHTKKEPTLTKLLCSSLSKAYLNTVFSCKRLTFLAFCFPSQRPLPKQIRFPSWPFFSAFLTLLSLEGNEKTLRRTHTKSWLVSGLQTARFPQLRSWTN